MLFVAGRLPRASPYRGRQTVQAAATRVVLARRTASAVATTAQGDGGDDEGVVDYSAKRPKPAKSQRGAKARTEPEHALALWMRYRESPRLICEQKHWDVIRQATESLSTDVRILTLQLLQARDLLRHGAGDGAARAFSPPAISAARLAKVAAEGYTMADIELCAWVVAGDSPDDRLSRFLSEGRKTARMPFLLLQVIHPMESFGSAASLQSLLDHVQKYHVALPESRGDGQRGMVGRFLAPNAFETLVERLVHHCARLFPRGFVQVGQLVQDWLSKSSVALEPLIDGPAHIYALQCRIFNRSLDLLSRPAQNRPRANRHFNWEGQKRVFAASGKVGRPFIVNRRAFAATREVLVGLRKSPAERDAASRYSHTWPPYRRDMDGMDQRADPLDTLSRSVRSGIIARESGYAADLYAQALDVLGGTAPDLSPTIQVRSLPPPGRPGKSNADGSRSDDGFYALWAAMIRATRNPVEAWSRFRSPPAVDHDGAVGSSTQGSARQPTLEIYGEMFSKLLEESHDEHEHDHHGDMYLDKPSADADRPTPLLPGDVPRAFPGVGDDPHLSPFERARLEPPTVAELYERMLASGIRPRGEVLATLLRRAARTRADTVAYLLAATGRTSGGGSEGPLDSGAVHMLLDALGLDETSGAGAAQSHRSPSMPFDPAYLRTHIPRGTFHAFVESLCRTAFRRRRPPLAAPESQHHHQHRHQRRHHPTSRHQPTQSSWADLPAQWTRLVEVVDAYLTGVIDDVDGGQKRGLRTGLVHLPTSEDRTLWHVLLATLAGRFHRLPLGDDNDKATGAHQDGNGCLDTGLTTAGGHEQAVLDRISEVERTAVQLALRLVDIVTSRVAGTSGAGSASGDPVMLLHLSTALRNAVESTVLAEHRRRQRPGMAVDDHGSAEVEEVGLDTTATSTPPLLFFDSRTELVANLPPEQIASLRKAHARLRSMFAGLVRSPADGAVTLATVESGTARRRPILPAADFHPAVLHAYLLALAACGDAAGMRTALHGWLAAYADPVSVATFDDDDRQGNWRPSLRKAFCAFRAYGEPRLGSGTISAGSVAEIRSREVEDDFETLLANLSVPVPWPTDDEVAAYAWRAAGHGSARFMVSWLWDAARGPGSWRRLVSSANHGSASAADIGGMRDADDKWWLDETSAKDGQEAGLRPRNPRWWEGSERKEADLRKMLRV